MNLKTFIVCGLFLGAVAGAVWVLPSKADAKIICNGNLCIKVEDKVEFSKGETGIPQYFQQEKVADIIERQFGFNAENSQYTKASVDFITVGNNEGYFIVRLLKRATNSFDIVKLELNADYTIKAAIMQS